ncbi:hypothetical protein FHX81_2219 [Saccharothrix saharensis]|uniref:Uncharacterized protein n=1 Tax=Saccharothrix saharensis TaxID=571190 RepID=A0A543JAP7_9PSEU|nr:hypothetical protein FHX81_2219 [Saccharothrix saharensis]
MAGVGACIPPSPAPGPITADRRLGGPPASAFIGNGCTVGALPGSAVALRRKPRRPLRVAVTIPAELAPLLVLLAAAAVPAGVRAAVYAVLAETARQVHVPADLVARATGRSTVVGPAAAPWAWHRPGRRPDASVRHLPAGLEPAR